MWGCGKQAAGAGGTLARTRMHTQYIDCLCKWRTLTISIKHEQLKWKSSAYQRNPADDYVVRRWYYFFQYTIKFTLSSLPTKHWCSFMAFARMCWLLSGACADFYGRNCSCVCAPLTLCTLSSSLNVWIGMPANEIETETIWMNKLHIMLKINERYFNWIEIFFLLLC